MVTKIIHLDIRSCSTFCWEV